MNNFIEQFKLSRWYLIGLPIYQYWQQWRWKSGLRNRPVPHLVKRKLLKHYAKKYQLKILIETGTYLGEMVRGLESEFDLIYTIELDPRLAMLAKDRFKARPKIKVYQGDSSQVLPKILRLCHQPVLYWLDAHYSAGLTAGSNQESPILSELKLINGRRNLVDIVLIDDANLFNGKDGYPKLVTVKKLVSHWQPSWRMYIENNIVVIVPN